MQQLQLRRLQRLNGEAAMSAAGNSGSRLWLKGAPSASSLHHRGAFLQTFEIEVGSG